MNSFDFLDSMIADDFCSAVNRLRKDAGLDLQDQRILLLDTAGDVSMLNVVCRNYRSIASPRTGCTGIYSCSGDDRFVEFSFKYYGWFYSKLSNYERTWTGKAALVEDGNSLPEGATKISTAASWSQLLNDLPR